METRKENEKFVPVKKKYRNKIVWLHFKSTDGRWGLVSKYKKGTKKYKVNLKELKYYENKK